VLCVMNFGAGNVYVIVFNFKKISYIIYSYLRVSIPENTVFTACNWCVTSCSSVSACYYKLAILAALYLPHVGPL
jgi:hypothetical protein